MKKSIIVLLIILVLTGCTSTPKQPEQVKVSNTIVPLTDSVKTYAASVVSELSGEEYYLTNGIVALSVNKDAQPSNGSQTTLYPVYCNEELACIIVDATEMTFITIDSSVKSYLEKEVALVEVEGSIYAVNSSNSVLIYGEEKSDNMSILKKINSVDYVLSLDQANADKTIIEKEITGTDNTIFVDGLEYSNSRIIVQFVEGDINSQIADFEKFCNGKLKSALDSVAIYVFTFDALDADALLDLLDDALALDYVQNAELDGVVHTWNSDNTVAY